MGEINDATVIETLRRQLAAAATRQVVAASNLPNVDTPGYRAQEVDFARTLDRELEGSPLTTTHPKHLTAGGDPAAPAVRDAEGAAARRDGNTVQVDRELIAMTSAAGDFARAQTVLAAKFRLVRYAINEGR